MKGWDVRKLSIASVGLAVVFFLALNVFSSTTFTNAQVDLTADGLYTLSDGTREVLATVDEPVTLRLFSSKALLDESPGLDTYAKRVEELLEQYVTLSNDKISLEIIHPEPFTPSEDRAVGFNIQGIPLDQTGELGYFGLAGTNTTDDRDVIGFLSPQREKFLEYDVTRMVNKLANPKRKTIGLTTGIPIEADPRSGYKPWRVVEIMEQLFNIKSLGPDPKITEINQFDVLMVVHPLGMTDRALYAIDQYVMNGGKVILVVDPYAEEGSRANAAMRMPPDRGSELYKLFDGWGLKYDRTKALGDLDTAQRVSAGQDGFGRPIIVNYLGWLNFTEKNLRSDDVITGQLQRINLASVGFISKKDDATFDFEPLITSSENAGEFEAYMLRQYPDPERILKEFKPDHKKRVVAARITGHLKSAFPDGPPKPEKKKEVTPGVGDQTPDTPGWTHPHKAEIDDAQVIVIADSDIFADQFWLQSQDFFGQKLVAPVASNGDFIINAIDNLGGGSALSKLRARGTTARPFDRVVAIQQAAEHTYRAKERELEAKLQDLEFKLRNLTGDKDNPKQAIMTAEQREEVQKFRREMQQTRLDLRGVQLALRQDIEALDTRLRVINIGAMPVAILLFAIGLWIWRRHRMRVRHGMSG